MTFVGGGWTPPNARCTGRAKCDRIIRRYACCSAVLGAMGTDNRYFIHLQRSMGKILNYIKRRQAMCLRSE